MGGHPVVVIRIRVRVGGHPVVVIKVKRCHQVGGHPVVVIRWVGIIGGDQGEEVPSGGWACFDGDQSEEVPSSGWASCGGDQGEEVPLGLVGIHYYLSSSIREFHSATWTLYICLIVCECSNPIHPSFVCCTLSTTCYTVATGYIMLLPLTHIRCLRMQ